MWNLKTFSPITMWIFAVQFFIFATAWSSPNTHCKAIPNSPNWPPPSVWAALNSSLSGQLIKTVPPGAVCHPNQPTYNPIACPAVQAGFLTSIWHSDDPVSSIVNNWNNDTCLPYATVPCSGEGYPVYVVNATGKEDVKAGVDFARERNVRLIVKGTGHDYLGRSSAPNALSIWTHHMQGLEFHDGFKPQGCRDTIDTAAITVAAGMQMLEIDHQASLRNLTIVGGGAETVGPGGFLTGGGHSAYSSTYGLGADQVLEIEMVTPGGEIITVNECKNRDLFWAMRGGGGSTFGVMTSVTVKAFPSTPFASALVLLANPFPGSSAFWKAMASILSQFSSLNAQGISGYTFIYPSFTSPAFNITSPVDAFYGSFVMPLLHPENSSVSLATALNDVFNTATAPYPASFFSSVAPQSWDDFYAWYASNNGPLNAGFDVLIGSRLMSAEALTQNQTAVIEAFKAATPPGSSTAVNLVAGPGVKNAKPRGGSNAVNPAWRKALVHTTLSVGWQPFDAAAKAMQEDLLTNSYVAALRKLEPDMGAYMNEADPNEPDWQSAFWGCNYPRLLEIKRKVDPDDVLWCQTCVGNERWEAVGDDLCRIESEW